MSVCSLTAHQDLVHTQYYRSVLLTCNAQRQEDEEDGMKGVKPAQQNFLDKLVSPHGAEFARSNSITNTITR